MSGSISATTLTTIAIASSVAAAGIGAVGAMQSASAQSAAAKYQAQVAEGDREIALQNASFAAASGNEKAAVQQQKTRAQIGSIEAEQGSSGVDINSPTSTSVRTSQTELGALDAQTIRSNAAREAYGYQTQANNFENSSSADTAQAKNAEVSGEFNAASGLLSGVGSSAFNYTKVMGNASGLGA